MRRLAGSITATPAGQPDLQVHRRRPFSTFGPPDPNHRVPHTPAVVTCEPPNGHMPPLRLLAWAHDPARHCAVVVSRTLGQPFPRCDGLFATHRPPWSGRRNENDPVYAASR